MIGIEDAINRLKPFIPNPPPWDQKTLMAAEQSIKQYLLDQYKGESELEIQKRLMPYIQAIQLLANLKKRDWPTQSNRDEMDSFPYFHIYQNRSDSKSGWGFLDMDHASWIVCIVSIGAILIVMWIGAKEFFR